MNSSNGKTLRLKTIRKTVHSPLYGVLGVGLPSLDTMRGQLDLFRDWLLHRINLPLNKGVGAYHEVAVATYARAKEMEQLILRQEADGTLVKGSALYKFRTGELRSFIDLAGKCIERGSREITEAQLVLEGMRQGF